MINFYYYFTIYPNTLPNKNTPFGKTIASVIDKYPQSKKIIIVDCCWGEWGQPEPGGILYTLKNKNRSIIFFNDDQDLKVNINNVLKDKRDTLVITSPQKQIDFEIETTKVETIKRNGWEVANFYHF